MALYERQYVVRVHADSTQEAREMMRDIIRIGNIEHVDYMTATDPYPYVEDDPALD